MKKLLLIAGMAILQNLASGTIIKIANSGFIFTPDYVTINAGDTINFQLGNMHNAVEVSQTTWEYNDITPLPGFSTPMGGGMVTGLKAGLHYYVCAPHASYGMKGRIFVNAVAGTNDIAAIEEKLKIVPNPGTGKILLLFPVEKTIGIQKVQIFDEQGKYVATDIKYQESGAEIDMSSFPDGVYLVILGTGDAIMSRKIVVAHKK